MRKSKLTRQRLKEKFNISAGSHDDVTAWANRHRVWVLSVNSRVGYAGLEEFDKRDTSLSGSVFIQNTDDLPEDFFEWGAIRQRNYLLDYL